MVYAYTMKKPTLHLMMGLPGAGKTTLAKILEELTKAKRLSSDEMRLNMFEKPCFSQDEHDRLYGIIDHNLEHLLAAGFDVIYDANLNRRMHRDEKYNFAKSYDANVKLWWVKTPQRLSKKRRVEEQHPGLVIPGESPSEMHDRVSDLFEEPQEDEAYIAVDGHYITIEKIQKKLQETS